MSEPRTPLSQPSLPAIGDDLENFEPLDHGTPEFLGDGFGERSLPSSRSSHQSSSLNPSDQDSPPPIGGARVVDRARNHLRPDEVEDIFRRRLPRPLSPRREPTPTARLGRLMAEWTAPLCRCAELSLPPGDPVHDLDLIEYAEYIAAILRPYQPVQDDKIFPLQYDGLIPADNRYNAFNFRKLLGGGDIDEETPTLSIEKSQRRLMNRLHTQLSNPQLQQWIVQVIYPSMVVACPSSVIQHNPVSQRDAMHKSNVKKEEASDGGPIDVRYQIPEDCLEQFSNEVVRRANEIPDFQDLTFFVSGHGLKITFKASTFVASRTKFFQVLDWAFHWNDQNFPPTQAWVDYGQEDTPAKAANVPAVTLLRKRACITDWLHLFQWEDRAATTSEEIYTWGGTNTAASASVHLKYNNPFHRDLGCAYNKAYNVCKEQFASPWKGHQIFGYSQLEALGFSQEVLSEWYEINSQHGFHGESRLHKLLDSYLECRNRAGDTLNDARNTRYGVRAEERILISHFRSMEPPDADHPPWIDVRGVRFTGRSAPTIHRAGPGLNVFLPGTAEHVEDEPVEARDPQIEDGAHLPYYLVLTEDANAYMGWQMSRWLFLIEHLILKAKEKPPKAELLVNGLMVSGAIRTLQFCLGNILPLKERALWLPQWQPRHHNNRNPDEELEGEEDPDAIPEIGLDYCTALRLHNYPFIPPHMVEWGLPAFSHAVHERIHLRFNRFQESFNIVRRIAPVVLKKARMSEAFRALVRRRPALQVVDWPLRGPRDQLWISEKTVVDETGRPLPAEAEGGPPGQFFFLGAELVVRQYILSLFEKLAEDSATRERPWPRRPGPRRTVYVANFLQVLDDDERDGLAGLSWDIITRLNPTAEYILTRPGNPRNGNSRRRNPGSPLWIDQMRDIFFWPEPGEGARPQWNRKEFWKLGETLIGIVKDVQNDAVAAHFADFIAVVATRALWTIPNFEAGPTGRLINYRRGKQANTAATRAILAEATQLDKIGWLISDVVTEQERYVLGNLKEMMETGATENECQDYVEENMAFVRNMLSTSAKQALTTDQSRKERTGLLLSARYLTNLGMDEAKTFLENVVEDPINNDD
ncbi:MAG: hypothetical protein MMC33_010904 [Icmadophila ericetorum]|nr:hypothetical protein [Icmadophila ericetorum]